MTATTPSSGPQHKSRGCQAANVALVGFILEGDLPVTGILLHRL